MILDGFLTFTGTSNGASGGIQSGLQTDMPNASTNTTQYSSNVIDLGLAGLPPLTGSNATGAGGGARDIAVGDDPMLKLSAIVTAAFNNLTSLQLIVQGTHDDGTGAPYATDWTTMWTSPVYALATLVQGVQLANVDIPRVIPGQVIPRYLRLGFVQVSGSANTTGLIEANIVIDRFDQIVSTANDLSGYQAGITVPN